MHVPTLAEKLGTTAHLSPLLQKARRLGFGPRELEILAVQRGCSHYSTGDEPSIPLTDETTFPNEELAVALLCPALRYDPHTIRCGAAMLSAPGNRPKRLARLLRMERAVQPGRQIAEAGHHFEPENPFWNQLLDALPPSPSPIPGVLPHPTRYVSMTGFTRNGPGLWTRWIRPTSKP
ncbi:MAG TPA: hypothetical protein PLX89_00590 [Verrucomicrobiota bacterium]|nr:hypothetical protein [Verrucomicrobiales bacterium]HRI11474.1 hypothetical protein [Verrucomicrobiota bacterium]